MLTEEAASASYASNASAELTREMFYDMVLNALLEQSPEKIVEHISLLEVTFRFADLQPALAGNLLLDIVREHFSGDESCAISPKTVDHALYRSLAALVEMAAPEGTALRSHEKGLLFPLDWWGARHILENACQVGSRELADAIVRQYSQMGVVYTLADLHYVAATMGWPTASDLELAALASQICLNFDGETFLRSIKGAEKRILLEYHKKYDLLSYAQWCCALCSKQDDMDDFSSEAEIASLREAVQLVEALVNEDSQGKKE